MRWALPGLNTRETALVFWLAVFFAFALSNRDLRHSIGGLLKLILTSEFLFGMIAGAALYAGACAYLLERVGYMASSMNGIAAAWFVFALAITFNTRDVDAAYYRKLLRRNLGAAVVIEFVVNVHTFPIPIELVMVPLTILLVLTLAVAEAKPEFEQARKLVVWLVAIPGLVALSYSLDYLARHSSEVVTAEKLKELFLPFVLTAVFLPFAVAVRYLVVWQTMLHMIEASFDDNKLLYRLARRRIIRACGISLAKAQLFESSFRGRLWGVENDSEVEAVIEQLRRGRRAAATAEVPEL
jgi:hypothetical protein